MSVTVSPFNPTQQSGCRAKNPPDLVIASRAPGVNDYGFFLGTVWLWEGNSVYVLGSTVISPTTKSAAWIELGGLSGPVDSITGNSGTATPTAGAIAVVGTGSIVTAASGSTDTISLTGLTNHALLLGAGTATITKLAAVAAGELLQSAGVSSDPAYTASPSVSGSLTAGTTITATSGNITATSGNFVSSAAGNGLVLNSAATSGTTTATLNGRVGQVTITTPSIAAGATAVMTISNTSITGSSTQVGYWLTGGTTGAALTIQSYANTANQSVVTIQNGTGATTNTASLILNFLVLN